MSEEFFKRYRHKIKSIDEIKKIIGDIPRSDKVIMCHGVFDVVHPGHVRHLAYAKSKAKILIVSITADVHITKAKYRPHVPENIRTLNLAAFEMVDYVIIDRNPNPNLNLEILKPDFFAKGFEYTSTGLPEATKEESKIVNGYGGEMIFTPGDIVYSSSNILEKSLPKLNIDKLLMLMSQNSISFESLKSSLENLSTYKVHVIGDTIVDSYTRTSLIGGQVKTPTLSVLFHKQDDYLGGAGIVSSHLKAAGANVVFTTVLGNDKYKKFVEKECNKNGVHLNAIVDSERPTTNKNVIISDNYRLLKVDTLENRSISQNISEKIIKSIKKNKCDCIIFSDFRHGIFNQSTVNLFTNEIEDSVIKVADSQVASRWGNICDFKNFDLIFPNEREARFSLADQDSSIGVLTSKLRTEVNFGNLILKLGEKGILCVGKENSKEYFNIGSFTENLVDPVGAGDALLSYSTLVYLKTNSLLIAGIIGSIAAACECEIDGNYSIKPEDIIKKIDLISQSSKYSF